MGLESLAAAAPAAWSRGVELEFAGDGGYERAGLADCGEIRFEDAVPVRPFRWSRGQRHFPGWWWLATAGRHFCYESWLERDHLMLLDFGPAVTAVPDCFARLAGGTGVVIDVRADDRIEPQDAEAFEVTARAYGSAGWEFRRVGAVDPVLAANVRWLSRYRHPRCAGPPGAADALRRPFAVRAPLLAGAAEAGATVAVLPGAVPPTSGFTSAG